MLIIITFFSLTKTQAQVTFRPGLRGGLGLSNLGFHGDFKPDYYIGALGQINLTKRYTLQPEITYTRQGANNLERYYYDESNNRKSFYTDVNIDYLSLAMINKFSFNTGLQIQFGPTIDFIVNTTLPYSDSDVDLGFVTGVGYKLPSGLLIEARFKADIIDNYGGYDDAYNSDESSYSPSFTFQVGVSYTFGKK